MSKTKEVQKPVDFTERALEVSNSKRIVFCKEVGKLKLTNEFKDYPVSKLVGKDNDGWVASSLLPKVTKYWKDKFELKGKTSKDVGKKTPQVVVISIRKAE